jgi:hypothetical protein
MVRNCPDEAEEVWVAHSGFAQWVVRWHVCPPHGELLDAGEVWTADYGQAPSWLRQIVMGDDPPSGSIRLPDSAVIAFG